MFSMLSRRWNPWRELEETLRGFPAMPQESARRPQLTVHEDKEGVTVLAEVPGLGPEDIEISVHGEQVTLQGKPRDEEAENLRCIRRERPGTAFERTFRLPFAIEAAKVEARVANGVLTLRLPRAAADQPRQIKVRAA